MSGDILPLLEDVDRAFAEHARRHPSPFPDGCEWYFSDPRYCHTEAQARQIVRACLVLGLPVTDVVTSRAWLTLVERLAELETTVAELKEAHSGTGPVPS